MLQLVAVSLACPSVIDLGQSDNFSNRSLRIFLFSMVHGTESCILISQSKAAWSMVRQS